MTARCTVSSAPCALCCRWRAHGFGLLLARELRDGGDRGDADLFLGPLQVRQDLVEDLVIAELADRRNRDGQRAIVLRHHLEQSRQRFRVADLGQRVGGALADPPVLVARRLDEPIDGALVAAGIEDLDRRAADVLVLVLDELEHGVDDARPADACQGVGGARPHPPVLVGHGFEQILDAVRRADRVQDLDRRPAAELVLGLQRLDEVLGRLGVVQLNDDVDGLVHDVEIGIEQQAGDQRDVDGRLRARDAGERRAAHELVAVAQRFLQRLVDVGPVEAREHVDQMRLDERVLAVHARQQIGHHLLGRDLVDELEDGGLLARLQEVDLGEQLADVEPVLVRLQHLDDRGLRVLVLAEQIDEPIDVVALVARRAPRPCPRPCADRRRRGRA